MRSEKALASYLTLFPHEATGMQSLIEDADTYRRQGCIDSLRSQVAAAAIVMSVDRTQLLLVRDPQTEQWRLPGVPWQPTDMSPVKAARKAANNQAGVEIDGEVKLCCQNPFVPLDIAVRQDGDETLFELRYAFGATSDRLRMPQAKWASPYEVTADIGPSADKLRDYKILDLSVRFAFLRDPCSQTIPEAIAESAA